MHTLTKLQAKRHDTELRERSKKNHRALLTQILGMRKELGLPLSLGKEILYDDRTDSPPDGTESETEDESSSEFAESFLYDGSSLTVCTSSVLILKFKMRHNLTDESVSDLLSCTVQLFIISRSSFMICSTQLLSIISVVVALMH